MKSIPPFKRTLRQVLVRASAAVLLVSGGFNLQAQSGPDAGPAGSQAGIYSPAELEELLGPIALYPDALIALILPASTTPTEITLASRFLAAGGTPAQIESQTWEESVISLTRYPDVITWLDENLAWTTAVGDAFATQPTEVMNALQRLRGKARAAGNLQDSSEQTVVEEVVEDDTFIRIVPADPEYIYVPVYDPQLVYVERSYFGYGSLVSFGTGFAIGAWLNYDCDWRRRGIYCGSYRPGWNRPWVRGGGRHGHRGQNNVVRNSRSVNVLNINANTARNWSPGSSSLRRANARHSQLRNANTSRVDRPGIRTVDGRASVNSARFRVPGSRSTQANRPGRNLQEQSVRGSAGRSQSQSLQTGSRGSRFSPAGAGSRTPAMNVSPQQSFSKRGGTGSRVGNSTVPKSQAPVRLEKRGNALKAGSSSRQASLKVPRAAAAPGATGLKARSQPQTQPRQLSGSSRKASGPVVSNPSRRSRGNSVQTGQSRRTVPNSQNLNRAAGTRTGNVGVQATRQSRATGVQSGGNRGMRSSAAAGQTMRSQGSWGGGRGSAIQGRQGRQGR